MPTNPQPPSTIDILAVRDFLMGATDEVRIAAPRPTRPHRPTQQSRPTVPVSQGIGRARIRSARSN